MLLLKKFDATLNRPGRALLSRVCDCAKCQGISVQCHPLCTCKIEIRNTFLFKIIKQWIRIAVTKIAIDVPAISKSVL